MKKCSVKYGVFFFSFALILPPPHPWHHTPWYHSPWDVLKATISQWCCDFQHCCSAAEGCEAAALGGGRKGGDFIPQNSAPGFPVGNQHLPQALPSPCWGTARFGKAKCQWWWNPSLRKMLIIGNSLHVILCICCASAAGEIQGRSLTLLSASLALVLVRFVFAF